MQSFLFYCLKKQLSHAGLFSTIGQKFEKSLRTTDFVDFIIIFAVEPLFPLPTALREVLK